jgi:DNA-binding transcriptional ArsR family regulator
MADTFIKVPLDVLARGDISPSAKLVYGLLVYRANGKGCCRSSLTTITNDTALARSTVQSALLDLEEVGLLTRERQLNGVRYVVTVPEIGTVPESGTSVTKIGNKKKKKRTTKTTAPVPDPEDDEVVWRGKMFPVTKGFLKDLETDFPHLCPDVLYFVKQIHDWMEANYKDFPKDKRTGYVRGFKGIVRSSMRKKKPLPPQAGVPQKHQTPKTPWRPR